jgi:PTH1 family peptidyl-tRNA hydrolase
VAPVVKYHNAKAAEDLLVVSDDIDLPVGKMRVRKGGSAGGHNGLKSVIERTGTPDFVRLRLGVGRDSRERANVIGHVLGKFSPADRRVMDEVVTQAVKAIGTIELESAETAMNRYNGWTAPAVAATAGEGNK